MFVLLRDIVKVETCEFYLSNEVLVYKVLVIFKAELFCSFLVIGLN
jgi:hypothetical protein